MSKNIDCVIAGHVSLDITPEFLSGGSDVTDIFRPGKLIESGPATMAAGGVVSNTGLAISKLGLDVKLMGRCGNDAFGKIVLDIHRSHCPKSAISTQLVDGDRTSYTLVLAPEGIDRIFVHSPGANDNFTAADIDYDVVSQAKIFHYGYPPLMSAMIADCGQQLEKMYHDVRATGATTSLDTSLFDPAGPRSKEPWPRIIEKTLKHVDIFTPSIEELLLMLKPDKFNELIDRAKGGEILPLIDSSMISSLADQCLAWGAAVVVIKCGYLGIYVKTADADRLGNVGKSKPGNIASWANREIFEPSYKVEKIVSATGAGDCAVAGFLAAWFRGLCVEDALRCACAVGGQNILAADAISGIRTWDETISQIRSKPEKNPVEIPLHSLAFDDQQQHYVGIANNQL